VPGKGLLLLRPVLDLSLAIEPARLGIVLVGIGHMSLDRFEKVAVEVLFFIAILGVAVLLIFVVLSLMSVGQRNADLSCISNLRVIDGAKHQWALVEGVTNRSATPTWEDLRPFLSDPGGSVLRCKRGGRYVIGALGVDPVCTYTGVFRYHGQPCRHSLYSRVED